MRRKVWTAAELDAILLDGDAQLGRAAIEAALAGERTALDDWLNHSYRGREDQRFYGENDASYPGWSDVEALVGRVFDHQLTQELSGHAIDSSLFFISRSDVSGKCCGRRTALKPLRFEDRRS